MSKPPPDNANLKAALRYAGAGWPVHPLVPGEKVPATKNGLKDATTDLGQIHHWWDNNPGRNVGIATGTPGPDVVDVDVKHGDGYASWNRLDEAGLVSRPMALVRTPSGGQHAYFRGTEQGNGSIKAANVDFRSKGGYVVAPPSTVGGKPYVVVEHANSDATADWTTMRQVLDPQPERQPSRGPARPSDPSTTLDRVANWAARAQAGDRNFPLFYAAKQAALAGADPAEIRDRLMRAAELNGLEGGPREARATIESGIRDAGSGGGHRPFVPPQPQPSAAAPAATAKTPEPAPPSPKGAATVATDRTLEGAELDQEIDRLAAEYPEPALSPGETVAQDPDLGEIFDRHEQLTAEEGAATGHLHTGPDEAVNGPRPITDFAWSVDPPGDALSARDQVSHGGGGLADSWLGGDDSTRPPDPQMEMS